jgi:hypothetical protein
MAGMNIAVNILARAAAMALVFAGFPGAGAQDQRMTMATASVRNVTLEVRLNGVLVETFEREQSGGVPLVLWLLNGLNEIVLHGIATGADPAAIAEVTAPGRKIVDFAWSAATPRLAVTFEGQDLPRWSWAQAPARPGAEAELLAAVGAAHEALGNGDEAGFRRAAAAHFADAALLLGAQQAATLAAQTWTALSQNPQPLAALSAAAYRGGQVYRVTGPDGSAPLVAKDKDDAILRFGAFWSFVEGRWQIVR